MKNLIVLVRDRKHFYDLENLLEIFVLKSHLSFTEDEDMYNQHLSEGDYGLIVEVIDDYKYVPSNSSLSSGVQVCSVESVSDVKKDSESEMCLRLEIQVDHHNEVVELKTVKAHFKRKMKRALYELMVKYYEPMSKWGILVGIRPVKIVHELMDQGLSVSEIRKQLSEMYLISEEKINLLLEIAQRERPYLFPIESDKISIYICIPFCPTRCLYCSFPSNSLEKKAKLVPIYLEKLLEEIKFTFDLIHKKGQVIDCIYIGGGTPTSLDAVQMERLLQTICEATDLSLVKEFTVEAGRPDTIDAIKLKVLKKYGVDRICINPQTMNDKTLNLIGRNHKVSDIQEVMQLAKRIGFRSINMDLIMGLPEEDVALASATIDETLKLDPENITIHTLAVKRASRLHESIEAYELSHDHTVATMMHMSDLSLRANGYAPYYMYRQKKMIGHLENVGYAKIGYESLYNMRIMEERHTIVALGAGAVSKICFPEENRFERVANFKGVEDYITRFDEVLAKKHQAY
ncbi:coproporphyrinogen dehydrogenase HemZ [Fusibacter ferrireducens]|uniref:Coproporphyrinogen dehydrogenase HemZ n=1 Tax=Fusibacter ferrireducens TaxID=2785058 RepID=A0ABR9ZUB0_9FIRM|nr:coproporphyrinogen dehydrogenase HemZ [Fusibacter ferrireducens]MBF4693738.1 coproporphyrinogen dehydrogenase HemZ [Fusibacter ferrireducens]